MRRLLDPRTHTAVIWHDVHSVRGSPTKATFTSKASNNRMSGVSSAHARCCLRGESLCDNWGVCTAVEHAIWPSAVVISWWKWFAMYGCLILGEAALERLRR